MQLRISVLARNRQFSKAMRQVRVRLQPLLDAIEATELKHPIHEAILVGITDEKGSEHFEEVENDDDGYVQYICGCSYGGSDDELIKNVFSILKRAVSLSQLSTPDQDKFEDLFQRFQKATLRF